MLVDVIFNNLITFEESGNVRGANSNWFVSICCSICRFFSRVFSWQSNINNNDIKKVNFLLNDLNVNPIVLLKTLEKKPELHFLVVKKLKKMKTEIISADIKSFGTNSYEYKTLFELAKKNYMWNILAIRKGKSNVS